jgi:muconolactone D-isomerase
MLFHVEMTVKLPLEMDPDAASALKARERDIAQALQRAGTWRHLWRVAGLYANVSIFDVESPQALHDLLMSLPLYPYMDLKIQALCRHPSSIHEGDA